jgi:hypothetical protein
MNITTGQAMHRLQFAQELSLMVARLAETANAPRRIVTQSENLAEELAAYHQAVISVHKRNAQ